MLPTHARYDDHPLPGRPRYTWPNGARLAVHIGLNLEHCVFGAIHDHVVGFLPGTIVGDAG